MALSLICDCGVKFEADDLLTGQEVPCPECGDAVKVPTQPGTRRLSIWACVALFLALAGVVTPAGGLLALIIGLFALLIINSRPKQLTGSGMALAAVLLGLLGALGTGVLILKPNLVPVGSWLRQQTQAAKVDSTGALELVSRSGEVFIQRPSRDWGRVKRDKSGDPMVGELQQKTDLLLQNLRRNIYVDVIRDSENAGKGLNAYRDVLTKEMNPPRNRLFSDDENGGFNRRRRWQQPDFQERLEGDFPLTFLPGQPVPPMKDAEGNPVGLFNAQEWVITQQRGGQKWAFIVRAYRKSGAKITDPIYVIRAYTPASRLADHEAEMRSILDTVTIQ